MSYLVIGFLISLTVAAHAATTFRPPAAAQSPVEAELGAAISRNQVEVLLKGLTEALASHSQELIIDRAGELAAYSTMPYQDVWISGYWINVMAEQIRYVLELEESGFHAEAWEALYVAVETWYTRRRVLEEMEREEGQASQF